MPYDVLAQQDSEVETGAGIVCQTVTPTLRRRPHNTNRGLGRCREDPKTSDGRVINPLPTMESVHSCITTTQLNPTPSIVRYTKTAYTRTIDATSSLENALFNLKVRRCFCLAQPRSYGALVSQSDRPKMSDTK